MAFGKKNKSNWDRIRNRKSSETTKYRDVYEDQQLERGDLAKVETMTTRNILNICVTVVVFALVWLFVSMVQMFFSGNPEREYNPHPQNLWVHVQAHYENVNNTKDKLTVAEFEELQATYNPNIPEVYEPVKPSEPVDPATVYKALESGGYVDKNNIYITTEKYVELVNEYKEYSAVYETLVAEYEVQLKAYNEYKTAITPPKDRYRYIKEHYKNRRNFDEYVLVEDYNNLVKEYELNVTGGKIDKDLLDIPFMPFNPAGLYSVSATGPIPVYDESGRPVRDEATGEYVMNPDQPIEYRHVFDGSKISYLDYNNMMRSYESEMAKYLEAYQAHRVNFHPENIDGTAKVLDLGPNLVKVGISGGLAAIVFGVLYMILSKNLKAQNLMSDTSDINQYKGDQHIALPEEIQRNYDWFPDVGAHSAVQVSSMISHMALTNKGLKTVKLAKRADKDIVDESGDIVSFKGEILEDQNGNPLTNTVPMIDEEFMEALFDASGAPKDKNVRRRYDATKIQYNPDGSNRDKLGKYDTVADLINDDWEFPIYEPQRPGGAYIVDTAPVNTINKQYAM